MNQTDNTAAIELHAKLASIDITEIDLVTRDRNIPRKAQAALARALFRKLGIKGVSITAPNYSMAQSVDVRLPKREDYVRDAHGQVDWQNDPAARANQTATKRVEAILLAAFVNSEDRSDTQSDHYNYRWSIN